MQSEENIPKTGGEKKKVDFPFTTMFQHTLGFGQEFISKEQYDNTSAPPIYS